MDNLSLIDVNKPEKVKSTLNTLINYMNDLGSIPTVTKESIGLGNVDNTSDINKPMSTPTKNYIDEKTMDKIIKPKIATKGNLVSFADEGEIEDSGVPKSLALENKKYINDGDASTLENAKSYTDEKLSAKADKTELPTKTSDLTNDSGFIDNTVNNLINYTLSTGVGSKIQLSINTTNYIMTVALLNADDDVLSTQTIDFPLESMVVGANYANGTLTLTLQNGQTLNVNISDIIDGLVPESRTINGKPLSNNITLTNTDVGAPSVNDLNNGLENKVDKVSGKQLSTNDYTTAEKNKLAGIESGAQVNNPIDNEFSTTSINSLQNNVITNKINQLDTSVSQNTENIELIKTYKLNRDPTLLWEGIANTNTNITLSFSITNFTWIYFTATNESNERCTQIVLRSDLQETDYDYPYNIAASHSDVARYINLYPMNDTHLTIKGVENMVLNRVYGV